MKSTFLPIVPHMLFFAFIASRPIRNLWSRSKGSSLGVVIVSNSRPTFISIISLLFERYSYLLYIPLVWNLLELPRLFYEIFGKSAKNFLPTQYERKNHWLCSSSTKKWFIVCLQIHKPFSLLLRNEKYAFSVDYSPGIFFSVVGTSLMMKE